jgi:hypothetical protein
LLGADGGMQAVEALLELELIGMAALNFLSDLASSAFSVLFLLFVLNLLVLSLEIRFEFGNDVLGVSDLLRRILPVPQVGESSLLRQAARHLEDYRLALV